MSREHQEGKKRKTEIVRKNGRKQGGKSENNKCERQSETNKAKMEKRKHGW